MQDWDSTEHQVGQELGDTASARAANKAIRSLVRAARAFLFYDAHNDAVETFLVEMRSAFADYCHRFGDMDLDVGVDELWLRSVEEIIYRDVDRERSLAYRLYRDGVRRVTIRSQVPWEELVGLLEVLSIRYTGLRQHEDDIVTLLRRASFEAIQIEAMRGFIASEDAGDAHAMESRVIDQAKARVDQPHDTDLPPPRLGERVRPSYVPLPEDICQRTAAEASPRRLPLDCLALATTLLAQASDPTGPLPVARFKDLLTEIRDYLLSVGEVRILQELAGRVQETPADLLDAQVLDDIVNSFGDRDAISRLIRSVSPEVQVLPEAIHTFLDTLEGDVPATLMDLLHDEHSAHLRRVLRQALEPFVKSRQTEVMARIRSDPGRGGPDLLRALSAGAPEAARRLVLEQARTGAEDIQVECIHTIARSSHGPTARSLLLELADGPRAAVRVAAIKALAGFEGAATFGELRKLVEHKVVQGLEDRDARALAESMAAVAPGAALALFREWIEPPARFRRARPGQDRLTWIAVAGLTVLEGPRIDAQLKELAERSCGVRARHAPRAGVLRARARAPEEDG